MLFFVYCYIKLIKGLCLLQIPVRNYQIYFFKNPKNFLFNFIQFKGIIYADNLKFRDRNRDRNGEVFFKMLFR